MRTLFVVQFAVFAVLAFALAANWWVTLTRLDLYWLAVPAAVVGVTVGLWAAVMAFVAAFATYRKHY